MNKKQRKEKNKQIIKNKKLCKKYPFIIPRTVTGEMIYQYDYTYTMIDCLPIGWNKRMIKWCEKIRPLLVKAGYLDKLQLIEVKEKYGLARIYTNSIPEAIYDEFETITNKFEKDTGEICIDCGKKGKMKKYFGFEVPFCEKCYEKNTNIL